MLRVAVLPLAIKLALWRAAASLLAGDPDCWMDGATPEECCESKLSPRGNPRCFDMVYTYERCCQPVAPTSWWEDACIEEGAVFRHAGEHGVFKDVSAYNSSGCFMSNCKSSDKFDAKDRSLCARACAETQGCTHWSFGPQLGRYQCFLRQSNVAREAQRGWWSGSRECAPQPVHPAQAALTIADSKALKACDKGKRQDCSDILAAVRTWKLAFSYLWKAVEGRIDSDMQKQIEQISTESANVEVAITGEYRPSENPPDFPRTVYNNRLIFNHLRTFLSAFPTVDFQAEDISLPVPLRLDQLCSRETCY